MEEEEEEEEELDLQFSLSEDQNKHVTIREGEIIVNETYFKTVQLKSTIPIPQFGKHTFTITVNMLHQGLIIGITKSTSVISL